MSSSASARSSGVDATAGHDDKSRKTDLPFKIYHTAATDSSKIFRSHLPISKSSCIKACEAVMYNPRISRMCIGTNGRIAIQDYAHTEHHQGCCARNSVGPGEHGVQSAL